MTQLKNAPAPTQAAVSAMTDSAGPRPYSAVSTPAPAPARTPSSRTNAARTVSSDRFAQTLRLNGSTPPTEQGCEHQHLANVASVPPGCEGVPAWEQSVPTQPGTLIPLSVRGVASSTSVLLRQEQISAQRTRDGPPTVSVRGDGSPGRMITNIRDVYSARGDAPLSFDRHDGVSVTAPLFCTNQRDDVRSPAAHGLPSLAYLVHNGSSRA